MDIIKLSQLGEGNTLEYKRNTDALDSILKSVSAFANTAGGIILIGIEDNGTIVGVSDIGKIQEQLSNSILNRIKPQLIPEITVTDINNKSVISVQIEHEPGPYYLGDKGEAKGVYIRVGNSNRLAGPEVIAEIKRSNNYSSFDKAPCGDVTETGLDKALIKSIYASRGRAIDTSKLISLGVLTKKGRRIVATHGGVILFGLPEIRETYCPYAEVRCARFKGTSRSEFIDRLNIEGGILAAIDEVPKFIRRNTKMAGKFGSMRRRDIPEYPVEGIREAITNAIAHANYEVTGSRIFIAIYDDRLEIQNPGIMMPGMSIEQFKAGVSRIRNPVIAKTLGQLELIEEWGSGYKRIQNACEQGGYPLPEWEEFGSALRVTFYPHPEVVELGAEPGTQLAPSLHSVIRALDLDDEMINLIEFCKEQRAFQAMLEYMGWKDRTKFRRRFISPLLEKGIIERTIPEKPSSSKQRYQITNHGLELLQKFKEI
ncbi:MAG: hypothetical protein GW760_07320 [Legionella sp.]|nr:hypothetical protein [Legionella sp.]